MRGQGRVKEAPLGATVVAVDEGALVGIVTLGHRHWRRRMKSSMLTPKETEEDVVAVAVGLSSHLSDLVHGSLIDLVKRGWMMEWATMAWPGPGQLLSSAGLEFHLYYPPESEGSVGHCPMCHQCSLNRALPWTEWERKRPGTGAIRAG